MKRLLRTSLYHIHLLVVNKNHAAPIIWLLRPGSQEKHRWLVLAQETVRMGTEEIILAVVVVALANEN